VKQVKRILLEDQQAQSIAKMVERLRKDSCKVDASKVVNQVINLYFEKYQESKYQEVARYFFDTKNYLKSLLTSCSEEETLIEKVDQFIGQQKKRRKSQKTSTKDKY
jgi:hypothetical protein